MDKFLIKRQKLSDSVDSHSKSGSEIDFTHCKCLTFVVTCIKLYLTIKLLLFIKYVI